MTISSRSSPRPTPEAASLPGLRPRWCSSSGRWRGPCSSFGMPLHFRSRSVPASSTIPRRARSTLHRGLSGVSGLSRTQSLRRATGFPLQDWGLALVGAFCMAYLFCLLFGTRQPARSADHTGSRRRDRRHDPAAEAARRVLGLPMVILAIDLHRHIFAGPTCRR